jgi:hypothetical protein
MSSFAGGRPTNLLERLMWRAAPRDPEVLRALEKVASRRAGPLSPLHPRIVARAAYAALAG